MFETLTSTAYDLYQPFPNVDQWVIDNRNNHKMHGTLKEICLYMVKNLGFKFENIEDGLNMLADYIHRGDNGIHFGTLKTSIYTFKKEEKYERAS